MKQYGRLTQGAGQGTRGFWRRVAPRGSPKGFPTHSLLQAGLWETLGGAAFLLVNTPASSSHLENGKEKKKSEVEIDCPSWREMRVLKRSSYLPGEDAEAQNDEVFGQGPSAAH